MSANNKVFRTIVADPTTSVVSVGTRLYDAATGALNLGIGQVGVFNADTLLALDASTIATAGRFFVAVGVDPKGTGAATDIRTSAGQAIQKNMLTQYTTQDYQTRLPQVTELSWSDSVVECDTEYCVKIKFENARIHSNYGYNDLDKTFVVVTPCGKPGACTCDDLANLMVTEINNDPDQLVNAVKIRTYQITSIGAIAAVANITIDGVTTVLPNTTYTVTTDNAVLQADIAALLSPFDTVTVTDDTTNFIITIRTVSEVTELTDGGVAITPIIDPTSCEAIRLTGNFEAQVDYCSINPDFIEPNGMRYSLFPACGWECDSTITDVQDLRFEHGDGYHIQQLEYESNGWQGSPYRSSMNTLIPNAVERFSDKFGKYYMLTLTYDDFHVGGWQEFRDNLSTTVVTNCGTDGRDLLSDIAAILDGAVISNSLPFAPLESTIDAFGTTC